MRIACQQIGKPAADTGGKEAVPRAEHQTGQQAHALTEIRIARHGRDLHDHRRHAAKRREHRAQNQLPDRFISLFHNRSTSLIGIP